MDRAGRQHRAIHSVYSSDVGIPLRQCASGSRRVRPYITRRMSPFVSWGPYDRWAVNSTRVSCEAEGDGKCSPTKAKPETTGGAGLVKCLFTRCDWLVGVAVLLVGSCPTACLALDFEPTEPEWLAWPQYCRARYVVSGAGRDSVFALRVNQAEVSRWESSVGDGWPALHHFCAGLAKVDRAARVESKDGRISRYADAINEYMYFIARTPPTHPLYAEAAVRICLAKDSSDATAEGLDFCDRAITAQPTNPIGYTAKATVHRRHKSYVEALAVLDVGDQKTGSQSAEIRYFLGLTCLDLRDYRMALEYARSAYALGYPLPGLRNRLKAAGYELE